MNNKTYHISKTRKEKNVEKLELDKLDGYQVNPKVKEEGAIKVDKVLFTDGDLSEKIIRKKIDNKIEYLLYKLRLLDTDEGSSGSIEKSLMDAEKLRLQLINKYVKYLGHTYYSLTLKKIELLIDEFNYRLYMNEFEKEGRRGR
jgi:hypothetical protein